MSTSRKEKEIMDFQPMPRPNPVFKKREKRSELITSPCSTWVVSLLLQKSGVSGLTFKMVMSKDIARSEDEAIGKAVRHWDNEYPHFSVVQTLTQEIIS